MQIRVLIPRILQEYVGGKAELSVAGQTVSQTLVELQRQHPQLYVCICDEAGQVRRHINLFLNDNLLVVPDALDQQLSSGDTLSVFQAVSGG